jgi:hypothetical protein
MPVRNAPGAYAMATIDRTAAASRKVLSQPARYSNARPRR